MAAMMAAEVASTAMKQTASQVATAGGALEDAEQGHVPHPGYGSGSRGVDPDGPDGAQMPPPPHHNEPTVMRNGAEQRTRGGSGMPELSSASAPNATGADGPGSKPGSSSEPCRLASVPPPSTGGPGVPRRQAQPVNASAPSGASTPRGGEGSSSGGHVRSATAASMAAGVASLPSSSSGYSPTAGSSRGSSSPGIGASRPGVQLSSRRSGRSSDRGRPPSLAAPSLLGSGRARVLGSTLPCRCAAMGARERRRVLQCLPA